MICAPPNESLCKEHESNHFTALYRFVSGKEKKPRGSEPPESSRSSVGDDMETSSQSSGREKEHVSNMKDPLFQTLPLAAQEAFKTSGLTEDQVVNDWPIFLRCLYYCTPRNTFTKPPPLVNSRFQPTPLPSFFKTSSQPLSIQVVDSHTRNVVSKTEVLAKNGTLEEESPYSKGSSAPPSTAESLLREAEDASRHRSSRKKLRPDQLDKLVERRNPNDVFTFSKETGKGSFGKVYMVVKKDDKKKYAVKLMKKKWSEDAQSTGQEISLLSSCSHPNIIGYTCSYLFNDQVWLVMDYCDAGTLNELLVVDLSEQQIACIIQQVLQGVEYLHRHRKIHRDIKSHNILLNMNGDVKVADLGLCIEAEESTSMAGSKYWVAPEVITGRYNCKADVWSIGALMMEMAEGAAPYSKFKALKAMHLTATRGAPGLAQPEKWTDNFRDFLRSFFIMDVDQRPSAQSMLKHPFLLQAQSRKELTKTMKLVFLLRLSVIGVSSDLFELFVTICPPGCLEEASEREVLWKTPEAVEIHPVGPNSKAIPLPLPEELRKPMENPELVAGIATEEFLFVWILQAQGLQTTIKIGGDARSVIVLCNMDGIFNPEIVTVSREVKPQGQLIHSSIDIGGWKYKVIRYSYVPIVEKKLYSDDQFTNTLPQPPPLPLYDSDGYNTESEKPSEWTLMKWHLSEYELESFLEKWCSDETNKAISESLKNTAIKTFKISPKIFDNVLGRVKKNLEKKAQAQEAARQAAINNALKKMQPNSITSTRVCACCMVKGSSYWRTGLDGTTSYCNKRQSCGVRFYRFCRKHRLAFDNRTNYEKDPYVLKLWNEANTTLIGKFKTHSPPLKEYKEKVQNPSECPETPSVSSEDKMQSGLECLETTSSEDKKQSALECPKTLSASSEDKKQSGSECAETLSHPTEEASPSVEMKDVASPHKMEPKKHEMPQGLPPTMIQTTQPQPMQVEEEKRGDRNGEEPMSQEKDAVSSTRPLFQFSSPKSPHSPGRHVMMKTSNGWEMNPIQTTPTLRPALPFGHFQKEEMDVKEGVT
ncbi:serine/threonine-protein kinase PAK 1-like [Planoprotostelium fungivorum]|uniref:Serine/threonine-protein kinase PAK 1-like n=1 Tax=Planoprotostelium fungivorum TaxID=1890364 RepID=A0A2P6NXX5_9EUKA|nr:serine/threonine-protein kinase PAK 1-like [Planoprotostelium fungivorum]